MVGRLLILLPIYLMVLVLLKGMQSAAALVRPLAMLLPAWLPAENLLSLVLVLIVCFLIVIGVGLGWAGSSETGWTGHSRETSGLRALSKPHAVQTHASSGWQPRRHGFAVAISWKRAGKSLTPLARAIVTRGSSSRTDPRGYGVSARWARSGMKIGAEGGTRWAAF